MGGGRRRGLYRGLGSVVCLSCLLPLFMGNLPSSQGLGALVLSLPDPHSPGNRALLCFSDRQLKLEAGERLKNLGNPAKC